MGININVGGVGNVIGVAQARDNFTTPQKQYVDIKSNFYNLGLFIDLRYYLLNDVEGDFAIYGNGGLGFNSLLTKPKEYSDELDLSKYYEPSIYSSQSMMLTPHVPAHLGLGVEKAFDNCYLFVSSQYKISVFTAPENDLPYKTPNCLTFDIGLRMLFQ